jgi:hypothetical protein
LSSQHSDIRPTHSQISRPIPSGHLICMEPRLRKIHPHIQLAFCYDAHHMHTTTIRFMRKNTDIIQSPKSSWTCPLDCWERLWTCAGVDLQRRGGLTAQGWTYSVSTSLGAFYHQDTSYAWSPDCGRDKLTNSAPDPLFYLRKMKV